MNGYAIALGSGLLVLAAYGLLKIQGGLGLRSQLDWEAASPDARRHQIRFSQVEQACAQGGRFYDVRGEADYAAGHFRSACPYRLADLEEGIFPQVDPKTPLYIHCKAGVRSARAATLLRQAGFEQVYDLGSLSQVEAIGGKYGE